MKYNSDEVIAKANVLSGKIRAQIVRRIKRQGFVIGLECQMQRPTKDGLCWTVEVNFYERPERGEAR
jgi:ribulose bisphosphate carboxylase small subunit